MWISDFPSSILYCWYYLAMALIAMLPWRMMPRRTLWGLMTEEGLPWQPWKKQIQFVGPKYYQTNELKAQFLSCLLRNYVGKLYLLRYVMHAACSKAFFMYFGVDLSSTPESRSMQALASSTVDELLSLSSPWPLTAIFGFSAGATAGMDSWHPSAGRPW